MSEEAKMKALAEAGEAPKAAKYGGKINSVPANRKITPRETFFFDTGSKPGTFTNVVFFKSGRKWGIVVGK